MTFRDNVFESICQCYASLFANQMCERWNSLLFSLSLRGLGVNNWNSAALSGERWLVRRLLRTRKHCTVVDVGANQGDYTAMCLSAAHETRVIALEPHPAAFAKLSRRFADHSNVITRAIALGAEPRKAQLFDRSNQAGSQHASLIKSVIEDIHHCNAAAEDVTVALLDTLADELSLEAIMLLKIDTEGSEFDVLRGASRLLAAGRVAVCQIEFNEMNVCSRVFFRDLRDFLPDYRLFRLLPRGLLALDPYVPIKMELFGYQNIVALSNRHPAVARTLL